jgi:hypothetical protein
VREGSGVMVVKGCKEVSIVKWEAWSNQRIKGVRCWAVQTA